MNDRLNRILGDSPVRLLVRLLVLSFAVGVVLTALGLEPYDIVNSAIRFGQRIWNMGFATLDRAGHYLLLGAVVVLPVWLVLRLLKIGGRVG